MGEDGFAMGYALGQDSGGGGGNNGGMFGGDGWWAIILFALIFGWGGRGFGGGGGSSGGGSSCGCGCATQADVRAAVDQQTLVSKLDQQTYGLADATFALNNTIVNGFHGVDNAICTLGYQTQSGFNSLGAQLASCCCDIERGQDRIGYQIAECCCDLKTQSANNTRDIIDSQNAGTRAILDFLTQNKIASLTAENQALRFQASQAAQNQFITQVGSDIVNRLQPVPVPSYIVANPYASYGYHGGYGRGGDCGCGCGCN